jgi:hypothetical protein
LEGARSRVKKKGENSEPRRRHRRRGDAEYSCEPTTTRPHGSGWRLRAGRFLAPCPALPCPAPALSFFLRRRKEEGSGGGRRKGQEAVAAFTSEAVSRPHRIAWWWCSCSTRACPGSPHSGCSNLRATGRRQQLLAAAEDEEGSRHGGDHGHGTFLLWLASVLATHVLCVQKLIKLRVCSWKQNLVRCVPVLFTNRHVRACIDFCFLLFWWGLGRRK